MREPRRDLASGLLITHRGVEQCYAISHFSIAYSDELAVLDGCDRWEFPGRIPLNRDE